MVMSLDDFVLLGTTVPEPMKDGRIVRCSAGYSLEKNDLIRLYPLAPGGGLHRWDRFHVDLERNPKDNRRESYKLAGERQEQEAVVDLTKRLQNEGLNGKVKRSVQLADIDRFNAPSIKFLNDRRSSLGIITPELLDYHFEEDKEADDLQARFELPGMPAPEQPTSGRNSYPKRPKIKFRDEDGLHDLSFNGHDAYEWIRKNPDQPEALFDNLRWGKPGRDVRLLVGNLSHHRNSWVVIAYLDFAEARPSLLSLIAEEPA